jgi:hypothetical protein
MIKSTHKSKSKPKSTSYKANDRIPDDLELDRLEESFVLQAAAEGYTPEFFVTATGNHRAIVRGYRCLASALQPNPWNYNEMDEAKQLALQESISGYGFVSEIICRVHPDKGDPSAFQIIDGEHRFDKVTLHEVVPINVLLGFTESEIKKLTIIMDETPGTPDQMKLAMLIGQIQEDAIDEDQPVSFGLPFSVVGMDVGYSSSESGSDDDEPFSPSPVDFGGESQNQNKEGWKTLRLSIPDEAMEVIEQARMAIDAEVGGLHADPKLAYGRMLELLSAHYLN